MSDLIERQAVLDAIHLFFTEEINKIPTKETENGEVYVIHKCQPLFEMNKALCKRIKALPSVTTERTEHWIDHDKHIECNKCKTWFLKDHLIRNSFCPNCGADMRGDKE